ncbi:FMN reductase [Streptomyces daliensis]|uniref:FMN reductase n=1 Tax=Streptomyces daliensis TaxID=299421 RepID=A0A8T4IPT7_9ACTN|nr:FMN reductase [Streptomyces daliensis]
MEPLKLVAVSAGLSQPSSTRLLADRLAEAARERLDDGSRTVEVRVVELRDLASDIAHNMLTGFPAPALREAVEAVTEADGLIAVTPVFTASYSGLFKSFFDVIDNTALAAKPVLVAATGGTPRHSLVLDHAMRPLFSYLRALVVPTGVYAASEDWGGTEGAAGGGAGEGLHARIDRAAGELALLVRGRGAGAGTDAVPGAGAGADAYDPDTVVPFEEQLAALRPTG